MHRMARAAQPRSTLATDSSQRTPIQRFPARHVPPCATHWAARGGHRSGAPGGGTGRGSAELFADAVAEIVELRELVALAVGEERQLAWVLGDTAGDEPAEAHRPPLVAGKLGK